LQFIDVETCQPIEGLTADIWHCNSTGVYGGIIATGNGNTADATNINNTYCRGLQTTDSTGAVQFTSIFPGHYSGRATHVHIETHLDGTVLANGTYAGGSIAHIGQFFFDQDLITQVEALSPYSKNTAAITTNAQDRIVQGELVNGADPMLNYVLLGDSVSDGLFMWASFSVNQSATYSASPAAELTSSGGHAVSGGGGGAVSGGGGGGAGGNGTMPSGGMPSGGMPSGVMASGASSVIGGISSSSTSPAVSPTSKATTSTSSSTSMISVITTVTSSGGHKGAYLPGFRKLGFKGLFGA
jgi:hypothetical protein